MRRLLTLYRQGSTNNIIAAQRGSISNGVTGAIAIQTSRNQYFAHPKGAISNLKLVYAQWYYDIGSFVETTVGNSSTITASVEYPAGTFTQVTFSGSPSASIADGGLLTSDIANVTIPAGAEFWVRTCHVPDGTQKIPYTNLPQTANTLGVHIGTTSSGDLTMSGTIANAAIQNVSGPVAIVGTVAAPNARAYIVAGDSIAWGQGDVSSADAKGGSGYVARALVNKGAYTKLTCQGQYLAKTLSPRTKLTALIAALQGTYTDLACEFGINDLTLTSGMSTIQSNLQTYWGLYSGRISQCTISPKTTSTDGWITTVNQTTSTSNFFTSDRLNTLNAWIRGLPAGLSNVIEAADAFMSARDSDLWLANNPGLTLDGVHPTSLGAITVGTSPFVTQSIS